MFRIASAAALAFVMLQQPQQAPASAPGPVTPPKLLSSDTPALAQCKGITAAEVKLQFTVDAQGSAKDVKVLTSPGDSQSACALATIAAYQYLPAMQDGKPVAVRIVLTINVTPSN